jgi:Beta-propeller repeat
MMVALCLLVCCWTTASALKSEPAAPPQLHRLELADCDDVAFGPDDDLYLACHSPYDRLPTKVRGAKTMPDEMDAYVLRLNPRSGKLVFATRLAGNSFDAALRIKVDKKGYAYATGLTKSQDFPVSSGALQQKSGGGSDAFLVRIAPSGEIVYATLIGGAGNDLGNALDLDERGNVYVGGVTSSGDFPAQRAKRLSTEDDAFVCWLQPVEHSLSCRVFGGGKAEKLTGIVLDRAGGIYAAGSTNSADFPTTRPTQKALAGRTDLFLSRLALRSLDITFATFFGGSGEDSGWGIALDRSANPVVAGITDSVDLPGATASYQRRNQGKRDAFVASIDMRYGREIRSTYFGGSNDDESGYDGSNIKVDHHGNVWLAGITYSDDLPTRNASQSRFGGGNGDGFVAAFSANLKKLCFASYFGDKERNLLEGVAISPSGLVAATGVSFADAPSAFHLRFGQINAGNSVLLIDAEEACLP